MESETGLFISYHSKFSCSFPCVRILAETGCGPQRGKIVVGLLVLGPGLLPKSFVGETFFMLIHLRLTYGFKLLDVRLASRCLYTVCQTADIAACAPQPHRLRCKLPHLG